MFPSCLESYVSHYLPCSVFLASVSPALSSASLPSPVFIIISCTHSHPYQYLVSQLVHVLCRILTVIHVCIRFVLVNGSCQFFVFFGQFWCSGSAAFFVIVYLNKSIHHHLHVKLLDTSMSPKTLFCEFSQYKSTNK